MSHVTMNRPAFDASIARAKARCRRTGEPLMAILDELDRMDPRTMPAETILCSGDHALRGFARFGRENFVVSGGVLRWSNQRS